MSACEKCWEAASLQVLYVGGSVVDHYQRLLLEFEQGHGDAEGHD